MSFKKYIQITSVLTAFFALVFIKNALGGGSEGVAPIAPNPTIVASLPTTLTPSSSPLVRGRGY
ncbi:MAG: hypothetical protein ABIP54_04250 [Candidatus Andersenbacteria bacterium]